MTCYHIVALFYLLHFAVGNVPPTVFCPESFNLVIPKNQVRVAVTWDVADVTAFDQEDGDLTPTLLPNSIKIGDELTAGEYTVSYKAKDSGLRSSQCSFVITVQGASCNGLPNVQHGTSTCRQGAIYGQICKVVCDKGYEVLEQNGIECRDDGTYSGKLHDCKKVTAYQDICESIAKSPQHQFVQDIEKNFQKLISDLMSIGSLTSFNTIPRAEEVCSYTNNSDHGSCVFLRRYKLFQTFKKDSKYTDPFYRSSLLLHPEIAKFCNNPILHKFLENFPDIERIPNNTYQNGFVRAMSSLAPAGTTQLRDEALHICDQKKAGISCLLADVFDLVDRSNVFISHLGSWKDLNINRYFSALTFSSVLLKWKYFKSDIVKAVRPLTNRGQQNVLTNILSALSVYVDDGDDGKMRIVTSLFPEVMTDKICNNGKMCLFWRVVDQTRVYLKARQPSTSTGVKVRVLDSTLDKREFLQQKQMERMLQLMADSEYNLITVAEDLREEFKRTINDRFSELRTYFKKIHSFNAAKAKADLIVITQIKDLTNEAAELARTVDKDVTHILVSMVVTARLEKISLTTKHALTMAEDCNPLKVITVVGSSLMNNDSSGIPGLAKLKKSGRLVASIKTLKKLSMKVKRAFTANDKFFAYMTVLMNAANSNIKSEDFEEAKDAFLRSYNDFTPAIKRHEVTELGEFFSQVVDQACGLIEGTSSLAAAIPKGIIGATGICWTTKIKIAKLMEMYGSIYDKQFELVEVLAANVQAQVALEAADGIATDYTKVSKEPSVSDDVLQKLQQVAGMSYVSYRLMVIQVIRLYCDELEYQNGGIKPPPCKDTGSDISTLLSYKLPDCSRKLEFEYVPARKRYLRDTAFMDVSKLYRGEEVLFKIPNNKWLYQNGWSFRYDENAVTYVMGMEVYLPSEVLSKRDIKVEVSVAGRNELKPGGTRYRIEPQKPMIFEYSIGHGINCRQGHPFDNPYSTCKTNRVADICPQTQYSCFLEVGDRGLYPSILSDFKIRVTGYEGLAIPDEATRLYLRLGMRTCTYVPTVNSASANSASPPRQVIQHFQSLCCSDGEYWSIIDNACLVCPSNSSSTLRGYFCDRGQDRV